MQRKDPPPAPPSHWWFLAGTVTVNSLMFWAFYMWQRYREEGRPINLLEWASSLTTNKQSIRNDESPQPAGRLVAARLRRGRLGSIRQIDQLLEINAARLNRQKDQCIDCKTNKTVEISYDDLQADLEEMREEILALRREKLNYLKQIAKLEKKTVAQEKEIAELKARMDTVQKITIDVQKRYDLVFRNVLALYEEAKRHKEKISKLEEAMKFR